MSPNILRHLTPFTPFWETCILDVRQPPGGQQFLPYTLYRVQHLEEEKSRDDPVLAQSEMQFGVFQTDLEQAVCPTIQTPGCPEPKREDVIQRANGTRWSVIK